MERTVTPGPTPRRIALGALVFPPLGMFLLCRRRMTSRLVGILALLGMLLYLLPYSIFWGWVLMQVAGLELEWRGGFPPVPTFSKTAPDYDAVEAHRSKPARAAAVVGGSDYWTGFRGPARDGHYQEMPIWTNWPSAGLPMLWRQPVGGGYASFAIAGGYAYTIEQRRDQEAITAYDVESGREIWAHFYAARFDESMGGEGPRSTPSYDQERLYALGATGHLHCLDAGSGAVVWHKNILEDNRAANLYWAQSASPLIVGEQVIVAPGGPGNGSIVAYHKGTGERLWGSRSEAAAYSSPMLADLAGRTHLLVAVEDFVVGLNPGTGEELWSVKWTVRQNNRNIAQPVILGGNRFLLSAGYGTGSAVMQIDFSEGRYQATEIWSNRNLKNKFSSSVYWEGHIYGLDESILVCLDAATGDRCWKDGRYGYGQLLLASGHLVILSGEGELALVRAVPERYEEIARFPAIQGKTWNHPAIGGGRLLVRNASEMACYSLAPGGLPRTSSAPADSERAF